MKTQFIEFQTTHGLATIWDSKPLTVETIEISVEALKKFVEEYSKEGSAHFMEGSHD